MQKTGKMQLLLTVVAVLLFGLFHTLQAQSFRASDPGVRGGAPGAGGPIDGLTDDEHEMFVVGLADFSEEEEVADGVGPRFNFVGCAGCHAQPAIGGTSPAVNPLFRVTEELGFTGNVMPSFITRDGPIREARFQYNAGRVPRRQCPQPLRDHRAPGCRRCNIKQEDFEKQLRDNNIIFRIPSPTFGAGLIEQIPDSTIIANQNADSSRKEPSASAAVPTGMATTGRSPGSAGRRRTSRC